MKVLLLAIFGFWTSSLWAQGALVDYYRFEQDGQTVNFKDRMAAQGVTAVSGIVIHGEQEEVILEGRLARDDQRPVTQETRFPVGALSIYPVVIEILRLVELGVFSLDDPVQQYVPELKDARWWKKGELTLENIILFRRKLNGPYKPSGYDQGETLILPEVILTAGNKDFPDGVKIIGNRNKSANSNCTTALLLQVMLERHHKKPLAEIISRQVFQPLGMSQSFYASELTAEQSKLIPVGHLKGTAVPNAYRRYALQAAMGLWTTPRDYAKLIQYVFRAADGKDDRLISQKTAQRGISAQHAYHSLIFHTNDGGIYGGGNAKGFYTCIAANAKTGLIQVMFANGDVVWPLVNFALGQTQGWVDLKNSKEKISLVIQPGDEELRAMVVPFLKQYCNKEKIIYEQITQEEAPLSITATPAILFTSPRGWSVYGGKINAPKSIENYIRNARGRPVAPAAYQPETIIHKRRGSQTLGITLKWTDWKGDGPKEDWEKTFITALCEKWRANYNSNVEFLPNDRRYYLDVHPFAKGDSTFLSMAIFSQYDCIHPIFQNFATPVKGQLTQRDQLIEILSGQALNIINQYLEDKLFGEKLVPFKTLRSTTNFDPGIFFEEEVKGGIALHDASLDGVWRSPQAAIDGQPILQFNFRSPLDRYAGEVRELDGTLQILNGSIHGDFSANLRTLTMGNKDFDSKILKDYLITKKYPRASFSFSEIPIALCWDHRTTQIITGKMSLLGRELSIEIEARFAPQSNRSKIFVQVSFSMNIAEPFGLPGPDGPVEAKKMLDFYLQFQLMS